MSNNDIMNILLSHENLQGLRYENNILYYNGETIDMTNINLMAFFSNYSQLYVDQYIINPQDFFNIMKLHSKVIVKKERTRKLNNTYE